MTKYAKKESIDEKVKKFLMEAKIPGKSVKNLKWQQKVWSRKMC